MKQVFFKNEQKCPQTSLTLKKGCAEAKKFMDDCNKDFNAMEKFIENQHQKEEWITKESDKFE